MYITITLNPSLDRTFVLPTLRLGELNRARHIQIDASGKGINVSLALAELGAPSLVMGILGGTVGQSLQRRLTEMRFETDVVWVKGETRANVTLVDEATGQVTKVNEPGPRVAEAEAQAVLEKLRARLSPGDVCMLSGNLPPGMPEDIYARLIALIRSSGAQAYLDASGQPLAHGHRAAPRLLKCNVEEAEELLGRTLATEAALVEALDALREPGANLATVDLAAISRGADGLLLGSPAGVIKAVPPRVRIASPISAGDAQLAGLAWALQQGFALPDVARWGVAMGTATAMQPGSRVASRRQAEDILEHIRVANCRV